MSSMTIGRLATRAGVGVETVRFYERKGLLEEPPRRPSGYRQYPSDTVDRLRFIRRAKQLGFSLDEIKSLLALSSSSAENRQDVRAKARDKITDIELRIADLSRMKTTLLNLVETCELGAKTDACPILNVLASDHDSEEL